MRGKRRSIITIESHRLTVVHSRRSIELWCKECDKDLPMLTPEAAAVFAGERQTEVCRRFRTARAHAE